MYCEVLGQLSTSVTGSCQYPGSNARRWRCSQLVGNVHPCTAELIIICMRPSYLELEICYPGRSELISSDRSHVRAQQTPGRSCLQTRSQESSAPNLKSQQPICSEVHCNYQMLQG